MSKLLSIVIPAFNEQDLIKIAYDTISRSLKDITVDYEIVFVDDGSKDNTYRQICELVAEGHDNVHGLSFSRNFGKESAIFAGLKEAKGDCCVVMDCDMQHPPTVIPEMLRLWQDEGFQIVEGVKSSRGRESLVYKCFAGFFNWLIKHFSHIDLNDASDFMLLDRTVVDSLLDMPERAPFFRGLARWVGFKSVRLPFEVAERQVGTSKWSTKGLIKYAIHNITIFSATPLQLVTVFGILFVIMSLFVGGEALYRYFTGTALGGFTTVITLILLSSGLIMISLGIIGLYIAQIYDEIKARPRYIIKERC